MSQRIFVSQAIKPQRQTNHLCLACFSSSFVSCISTQGELEMPARAQGRFQTARVFKWESSSQCTEQSVTVCQGGGGFFQFCNSQHN